MVAAGAANERAAMTTFDEYSKKYECVRMERQRGILQVNLHTNDGPFEWGPVAHRELAKIFADIGDDRDNRVVILTGTGDQFSGPTVTSVSTSFWTQRPPPLDVVNTATREMVHLVMNMLNIEVPMIAAMNGPSTRHNELALLCDIVLASDDAYFLDSAHFPAGNVPGDGVHIIYPMLLGPNRGRYFLLMDEKMSAQEAQRLGLVGEVLPRERLLPRAWEIAERLAKKPLITLRHTRVLLTEHLRRQMHDLLGYGLAMSNVALMEHPDQTK
jgi:enoyl-CoA hydratase/carnithine racemase